MLRWQRGSSDEAALRLTPVTTAGPSGPEGGSAVEGRRVPRGRWTRAIAVCFVLAMLATACVSGGSTGNNAAPEASASPIVPKEPTKPVTITFSSWVGDSPQMKKFAADFH